MREEEVQVRGEMKKKSSFKIILTLATLLFLIVIIVFSPLFRISQIEIIGNFQTSRQEVLETGDIQVGVNIFSLNARQAADAISALPHIRAVSIERELPDNVRIRIFEREQTANIRVLDSSTYLLIDSEGIVLQVGQRPVGSLPIVTGIHIGNFSLGDSLQTDNPLIFDYILELSSFFALYRFFPDIVDFSNQRDITLFYENFEIAFGNMEDAQRKVRYLSGIIEARPIDRGYIDMRDLEIYPRIRFSN